MWNIFTRDTAAQRKIERLEGRLEVMADEKAEALELVNKLMKARDMWKGVAQSVTAQRDNLRQEVADQTYNASVLGEKLAEVRAELADSFIRNERGQIRHHPSYFAGREIAA